MFTKIDLTKVILDHLETLRDMRGKIVLSDIFVFFGIPVLVAAVIWFSNVTFEDGFVNLLVTSLSIFAALLFNLLLLIYDIIRKPEVGRKIKTKFLKEIFSNISYSIMVSILTVILLMILNYDIKAINGIIQVLVTFLAVNFILTLLMILKRVHFLLAKEFDESPSDQVAKLR